ncbi:MAG: hypothetical protein PW788_00865 [Micavibrio sp.]|nr:hypothetical protein [Micavibrio sp.]
MLGFLKNLLASRDIRCPACNSLSVIIEDPKGDTSVYRCTECKTRAKRGEGKLVKL